MRKLKKVVRKYRTICIDKVYKPLYIQHEFLKLKVN